MSCLHVLYVEDNSTDVFLLTHKIEKSGLSVELTIASTYTEFTSALENHCFDLILSDSSVPGCTATEAFDIAKDKYSKTPFAIISGTDDPAKILEWRSRGIADIVFKADLNRLIPILQRSLQLLNRTT